MSDEPTLEGGGPEASDGMTLGEIIDRAFDYRGNVTLVLTDGTQVSGYLFNRNDEVPEPFVQMFGENGDGPLTLSYAEIRTIRFTGRDMAAGNAYAAWLRARDAAHRSPGIPKVDGA